jgi:hypothetical protein
LCHFSRAIMSLKIFPRHLICRQKSRSSTNSDYDIRSNSAAAILEIAMASHARARARREQIKKDGLNA